MLVPTPRLALLFALGALLLAPAGAAPWLLWAGLLYNLALIAVCLADASLTPGADRLRIRRDAPPAVSLAVPADVVLTVANDSEVPLRLVLRDEVPAAPFGDVPDPPRLKVPPGRERSVSVRLEPTVRGRYRFGGVTARWRSRLGLFERQARWDLGAEVKVYPNLRALQHYQALQRAGRLLEAGVRAARLRGAGTEFESLRDYQPDDEFRRIDWGATARRGRLTSRQFEVERSQTVMLCLDAGRLMTTQLDDLTRLDHAINATLLLAAVAMQLQDRVGLLVFAEEPLAYLPPRSGRGQLSLLLETLYGLEGRLTEPDYAAALRLLGLRQRKRSLVVLFTDLVDPNASAGLLAHAAGLRGAHLPIFVSYSDPRLLALAEAPPETPEAMFERALADDVLAARETALRRLRGQGIAVVDAPPERAPVELINRYIEAKVRMLL